LALENPNFRPFGSRNGSETAQKRLENGRVSSKVTANASPRGDQRSWGVALPSDQASRRSSPAKVPPGPFPPTLYLKKKKRLGPLFSSNLIKSRNLDQPCTIFVREQLARLVLQPPRSLAMEPGGVMGYTVQELRASATLSSCFARGCGSSMPRIHIRCHMSWHQCTIVMYVF
jgi:hypothetical protein